MADTSRLEGNYYIAGNLSAQSMTIPDLVIGNSQIAAGAAIDPLKLRHQHRHTYAQPNTAATSETKVLHVVYGVTGSVVRFEAGSIVKAVGNSTVTVDLKKNGTTVLSAPITLDNTSANRGVQSATISVPALADNDVLEVTTVATIGTGTLPTGVYASLTVHEDAA
jgi:hypothetical protein